MVTPVANLSNAAEWVDDIPRIEDGWPPNGGPVDLPNNRGIFNLHGEPLSKRTQFLKNRIGGIGGEATAVANLNTHAATGLFSYAAGATGAPYAGLAGFLEHVEGAGGTLAMQTVTQSNALVYTRVRSGDPASWSPWQPSGLPIGTEVSWTALTAPPGFLFEDRSTVLRADYPLLWAHVSGGDMLDPTGAEAGMFGPGDGLTTFQLPDARGRFFRWADMGRGLDAGRTLGASQASDVEDHRHSFWGRQGTTSTGGGNERIMNFGKSDVTGMTRSISDVDGNETRPANDARALIIRAF